MPQASDAALLIEASNQQRILVSRDRHFGALVFHRRIGSGVVYLRLSPSTLEAAHTELAEVL